MKNLFELTLAWIVAALAFVSAPAAHAATMYYLDVPALVEVSDVVVLGEVVDADVFIGTQGRITTEWTVDVTVTLHGDAHRQVRFRQWTGELDGQVQHIPGDGRVEVGDEVVLFLHGDAPDALFLSALGQSVYHVHVDPQAAGVLDGVPSPIEGVLTPGNPRIDVGAMPLDAPVTRDFADIGIYRSNGTVGEIGALEMLTLGALMEAVQDASSAIGQGEGDNE